MAAMQRASRRRLTAATAATAVVDVLLGYTNGFASQLGGESQAITRLNNLVAITNQAYRTAASTCACAWSRP